MVQDRRGLILSGATAIGGTALAQTARPIRLSLGTATPGGGLPAFGAAFAAAANGADPALLIKLRNTAGRREVPEAGLRQRILVDNPAVLHDFSP